MDLNVEFVSGLNVFQLVGTFCHMLMLTCHRLSGLLELFYFYYVSLNLDMTFMSHSVSYN